MAVWNGFQQELLSAAGLPTAEITQEFLYDWSQHTASSCRNNPLDISRAMSGATNCQKLTSARTAKNYTSHAQAATAFAHQINSGSFPALHAALGFADPYQAPSPAAVVSDLRKWGSPGFASYYASHSQAGSGSGGGGGGGGIRLPKGHQGFHDMQKALGHSLPTSLRRSRIIRERVLRKLGAPRKVGG